MSEETKIEWATSTGNPWIGCTKVSPGCKNCYAATLDDQRFSRTMGGGTKEKPVSHWGKGAPRFRTKGFWKDAVKWNGDALKFGHTCDKCQRRFQYPESFGSPFSCPHCGKTLTLNRPRIFPSLCDWLDEEVPIEWLADFLKLIHDTPNLDWLLLTKRPENFWERVSAANALLRRRRDAEEVVSEMLLAAKATLPISGFPGYFVTNSGNILTDSGSEHCLWCGRDLSGTAKNKYCGQNCRQSAHYHGDKFALIPVEMSPDESDEGYQRVTLNRDGERVRELVHRIVLTHFIGACPSDQHEGCHKDGNPRNNHVCNLRWGTQSENWEDRIRHGNHRANSKLTPQIVESIKRSSCSDREASESYGVSELAIKNIRSGKAWANDDHSMPSNCWIGVSVEDQQRADERIPELLKIPAKVRFLSVEPLLGLVKLERIAEGKNHEFNVLTGKQGWLTVNKHIDWVIVGGESGPGARPCNIEWIRSIVAQCKAAGVPVFCKQLGSVPVCDSLPDSGWRGEIIQPPPPRNLADYKPSPMMLAPKHKKGGDPSEWPLDLRVREFPNPISRSLNQGADA